MVANQLLDLSSLEILDIFQSRLYLSRAYLISKTVAAIKNVSGQLTWIEFSPMFHSCLIKMALACIGTSLTPPSSLTAKKTIFIFILELLNDGAPSVEPCFNTNDSFARKKKPWSHGRSPKQGGLGGGQSIAVTSAKEMGAAAAPMPTPIPMCPSTLADSGGSMPVEPKTEPDSQPYTTPSVVKTDFQTPPPLSELAEPHSLPPAPTEACTWLDLRTSDPQLEEQCYTLALREKDGIKHWLLYSGRVDMRIFRATCEECSSRAMSVKMLLSCRNHTLLFPKHRRHANHQCYSFLPIFKEWVCHHIPMNPTL